MQMIHGTDIQLISESGAETVSNVLIGEPSETELIGHKISAFTLAIPKTDVHDWLDRKVIFFGNTFRTVGHPQQEQNFCSLTETAPSTKKTACRGTAIVEFS